MDPTTGELNINPNLWIVVVLYGLLFISGITTSIIRFLEYDRHPFNPRPLTDRLRRRAWSGADTSKIFGLYFLLYLVIMLSGSFFYPEQLPVVQIAGTIILWLVLLLTITRMNKIQPVTRQQGFGLGKRHLRRLYQVAPYYVTTLVPLLFVSWLYSIFLRFIGVEPHLQSPVKMILESPPLLRGLLIGMAVIGAPVFEEILFRGILFPYLLKKMPVALAIVLSSLIFAGIHFNISSFIAIFALSVALSFAYWRTGSLWLAMGMHALFNGINMLAILLTAS